MKVRIIFDDPPGTPLWERIVSWALGWFATWCYRNDPQGAIELMRRCNKE